MKILNKRGVTLVEGIVAMLLILVVVMGVYSVVLSSIRDKNMPDSKEEIAMAMDQVKRSLELAQIGQWSSAVSLVPCLGQTVGNNSTKTTGNTGKTGVTGDTILEDVTVNEKTGGGTSTPDGLTETIVIKTSGSESRGVDPSTGTQECTPNASGVEICSFTGTGALECSFNEQGRQVCTSTGTTPGTSNPSIPVDMFVHGVTYNLSCMLPPVCKNGSAFTYHLLPMAHNATFPEPGDLVIPDLVQIEFNVNCL